MSFMCHRASCRAKEGETKVPPMTPPLFLEAASGQGILYFAKKPTFSNSKQKGQCMRLSLRLHWLNIIVCRASIRRFLWEQCSLFAVLIAAFHSVWVEDREDTCRYGRLVHGGDTQYDQAQHGGEQALDGNDLEHGRNIGGGVETRACDGAFDVRIKTCCARTSKQLRDNVQTSVEE